MVSVTYPVEHYLNYAKAHRRFQNLPIEIRRKYAKFMKAGIGLIEFIKLHDEGRLDEITIIIIEQEKEKEAEEEVEKNERE